MDRPAPVSLALLTGLIFGLSVLGGACPAAAQSADPQASSHALAERAEADRAKGSLAVALQEANEAIRLDATDGFAFAVRGDTFNNMREFDRAIEDYNEAIRLDPTRSLAFMGRGAAYYFKGQSERAIPDYDEAIRLDPKNARAFTNRGAAYKKLGRNDKAIEDDTAAIRLDPTVPEYFDNRGLSLDHNGDHDGAIADFSAAIQLRPQANFLTNRADAYNEKGQFARAIADYDAALKLDAGFVRAYNNRGVAYRKTGERERALADFEQAIRRDPHFADAVTNRDEVAEEIKQLALVSKVQLPTFDCTRAKLAVEKAICSDPELARLDRAMDQAYLAALAKLGSSAAAKLRREQREFIATRNKSFGRPSYQFRKELEQRLSVLQAIPS